MSETAEVVRAAIAATAGLYAERERELRGVIAMHQDEATRLRLELNHAQVTRARERKELEAAHDRLAESLDRLERDVRDALAMPRAHLRTALVAAMFGRGEDEG